MDNDHNHDGDNAGDDDDHDRSDDNCDDVVVGDDDGEVMKTNYDSSFIVEYLYKPFCFFVSIPVIEINHDGH